MVEKNIGLYFEVRFIQVLLKTGGVGGKEYLGGACSDNLLKCVSCMSILLASSGNLNENRVIWLKKVK